MIDFQNARIFKLRQGDVSDVMPLVAPMLVEGESVFASFQGLRDCVIFTTKRIISVNVQGITGKKKDFTSLPYSRIQAFSVETAGTFDLDCELELYFSGLGKVRFEFANGFDIVSFNKILSSYVL
ncbi:MAG TPA: PH domain-containing protein [Clostridiaceae bacterium]|nr:PH domain-containing protein [Clostridiaceae bacterium]